MHVIGVGVGLFVRDNLFLIISAHLMVIIRP